MIVMGERRPHVFAALSRHLLPLLNLRRKDPHYLYPARDRHGNGPDAARHLVGVVESMHLCGNYGPASMELYGLDRHEGAPPHNVPRSKICSKFGTKLRRPRVSVRDCYQNQTD